MADKTFTEYLKENLDKSQNIQSELSQGVSPGRLHELVKEQGAVILWLLTAMVESQSQPEQPATASTVGL